VGSFGAGGKETCPWTWKINADPPEYFPHTSKVKYKRSDQSLEGYSSYCLVATNENPLENLINKFSMAKSSTKSETN
jgi:hypothetical protein